MATKIKPQTPKALLAASLPNMEVGAEQGEQVYYVEPPDSGTTNMQLRQEAIASLIAAD